MWDLAELVSQRAVWAVVALLISSCNLVNHTKAVSSSFYSATHSAPSRTKGFEIFE